MRMRRADPRAGHLWTPAALREPSRQARHEDVRRRACAHVARPPRSPTDKGTPGKDRDGAANEHEANWPAAKGCLDREFDRPLREIPPRIGLRGALVERAEREARGIEPRRDLIPFERCRHWREWPAEHR